MKPWRPHGGQQRVSAAGPARAPAPASTCGSRARHPPPPPPTPPPRPGPGPLRPALAHPAPRRAAPEPPAPAPAAPAPACRGTPAPQLWASLRAPVRRAPSPMRGARLERAPGVAGLRTGPGLAREAGRGDAAPEPRLWMATETAQRAHSLGTWPAGPCVKFVDLGPRCFPFAVAKACNAEVPDCLGWDQVIEPRV